MDKIILRLKYPLIYGSVLILSLALHILGYIFLISFTKKPDRTNENEFIKIKINSEEIAIQNDLPIKNNVKSGSKINAKQKKENRIPIKKVKSVLGIKPDTKGNSDFKVPIGNSLMEKDNGESLSKKEYEELGSGDLSAQPQLDRSSIEIPDYTQEALDSGLEGTFTVAIYVDENGNVSKAEILRKIGYGMDERVLKAASKTRFIPAQDKRGRKIPEWTEIKFRLEIP